MFNLCCTAPHSQNNWNDNSNQTAFIVACDVRIQLSLRIVRILLCRQQNWFYCYNYEFGVFAHENKLANFNCGQEGCVCGVRRCVNVLLVLDVSFFWKGRTVAITKSMQTVYLTRSTISSHFATIYIWISIWLQRVWVWVWSSALKWTTIKRHLISAVDITEC